MWKKSFFALILGSAFLAGCNADNAQNDDNENENGEEIIDNQQDAAEDGNDLKEGVNDNLENDPYDNNINGNDTNNATDGSGGKGEDAYNDATRGSEGQEFNSENGTDNTEDDYDEEKENGTE